jgi:carbonic anhydrase
LLRSALVGAATGVITGAGVLWSSTASAQTVKTPDEALNALMAGNRRFVERKLTFYEEDLAILQQNTAEKQEPFASVLSCADSRVPVELIFDQSIGHVFVNRVAGNIATTEIMASIEYGALVLVDKI